MPTQQEIVADLKVQRDTLAGGGRVDVIDKNEQPGAYTKELRYSASEGGFFIVVKTDGDPGEYVPATVVMRFLLQNAKLRTQNPNNLTEAERPDAAALQLASLNAMITKEEAG